MRYRRLLTLLTVLSSATPALARVNDDDRVVQRGHVHPGVRPEAEVGAPAPMEELNRVLFGFAIPPERLPQLDEILAGQRDPSSPWYRRWLTPEEFGAMFGPSDAEVSQVAEWLGSHGLRVDEVARSGMWLQFSGTVADVERAFRTRIKRYRVNGELHQANDRDPSIPRGLLPAAAGVVKLHDFGPRPLHAGVITPRYTSGGSNFLSPGDFAIIYGLTALRSRGLDGTGQAIAIVARANPGTSNWTRFRNTMGLPASAPQIIVPPGSTDPGPLTAGENAEADLDVEWAGAVAPGAQIKFVTAKSTTTTDGVELSASYIVNANLAPVMSVSFGLCEGNLNAQELSFWTSLWAQAASQGITPLVASGDSGAAGCTVPSASAGTGRAVNGLGSSPNVISVGGTQFDEGGGTYWNSQSTGYVSALGYVPERAWNESGATPGGSGLWATGGGVSSVHARPSWQVAPGVPAGSMRVLPDVSLSAASHGAYLVVTGGSLGAVYGTSASAPALAGIMALVVQANGRLGNANPRLYQLASAQWSSGGAAVFHDTAAGDNGVPQTAGYACTSGYDQATGLGSVNATTLVDAWSPASAAPAPALGGAHVALATALLAVAGAARVRPRRHDGAP
jgi:subtilase family serine protease